MKLVIVESPAKSKTIGHYLGNEYQVEASVGHIRDLAIKGKGGLGVDIEDNFKPTYVINKDKVKVVNQLKRLVKKSDEVILATDPDREGEQIAYSLAEALGLDPQTTKRLEFHEITRNSILEAIENPRTIDMNLVHSQETRRIIDRILGFMLSKLLQSKIGSKSAGRVQSVALKLICDHEKEILQFVPTIFFKLNAFINKDNKDYQLELYKVDGTKKSVLKNEEEAKYVKDSLSKVVKVSNIDQKEKFLQSKEPFRTSTLQQAAFSSLGFSTKETTFLAQELYEGVETDEGAVGLITYIRTDSTRISESFVNEAKPYIIEKFGNEYYKGVHASSKSVNAQDAHECIRPTSVFRTPEKMKKFLSPKAYKLYKLIYERTLSSLMSNKKVLNSTYEFESNNITFKLSGSKTLFRGYDIFKNDEADNVMPDFKIGETYELLNVDFVQDETKAPARYSEGKIVKIMEEKGIGRPSTYASTIQTLVQRKYVTSQKGILTPTEQGILTTNVLNKYFPSIVNTEYTAEMENSLDKIQNGEEEELRVISDFYYPFLNLYDEVKEKMYKEPLKKTGEKCPQCGNDLVERFGKYGKFVACSNYPNCTYIKKEEKEETKEVGRACPECGSALIYRKNKKGQMFIGCSAFPKCRHIESLEDDTEEVKLEKRVCPNCGAELVVKNSRRGKFYACPNYPKCKHTESIK